MCHLKTVSPVIHNNSYLTHTCSDPGENILAFHVVEARKLVWLPLFLRLLVLVTHDQYTVEKEVILKHKCSLSRRGGKISASFSGLVNC